MILLSFSDRKYLTIVLFIDRIHPLHNLILFNRKYVVKNLNNC